MQEFKVDQYCSCKGAIITRSNTKVVYHTLIIKDISSDSVKQAGALNDPFKMHRALYIWDIQQLQPQKWHSFLKSIMEGSNFGSKFCMTWVSTLSAKDWPSTPYYFLDLGLSRSSKCKSWKFEIKSCETKIALDLLMEAHKHNYLRIVSLYSQTMLCIM